MSRTLHHRQRAPFCWADGGGRIEDHCPLPTLLAQLEAATDAATRDALTQQIDATIAACDAKYETAVTVTTEKGILEAAMPERELVPSCKARNRMWRRGK